MKDTSATRGVFAIISPSPTTLLLSEYRDREHWNLPGGGVRDGESDQEALYREVLDETGLHTRVLHQIGPPHTAKNDVAALYQCEITGGTLIPTEESRQHLFADFCSMQKLPIISNRMGRMIVDGYSVLRNPIFSGDESAILQENIWTLSYENSLNIRVHDGYLFQKKSSQNIIIWDRIEA